jgi:hypothetical protein
MEIPDIYLEGKEERLPEDILPINTIAISVMNIF